MGKRKLNVLISVLLMLSMLFTSSFASSDKLEELDKEKRKKQQELSQNKKEQRAVTQKMLSMDKTIGKTEGEISSLNSDISRTVGSIAKKENELKDLEASIGQNQEMLKKRLRVMYKTSNIEYMEIALSSKDVTELLSNMDMVTSIVGQDKKIISDLKSNKEKVQQTKQELQDSKNNMVKMKNSLNAKKSQLETSIAEQSLLKKKLKEDAKELEESMDELNRQSEQIRLAILKEQSNGAYSGGSMAWPLPGFTRISSPYGMRYHPVLKKKKFHSGIDIPGYRGSKVIAANDGTVTFAGYSGGYGNMVRIDHGGKIMTVYAHNSALLVKKGDKVKRGQTIAKCGSTGRSTGNHVHFEVRINGKTTNPLSYVRGK